MKKLLIFILIVILFVVGIFIGYKMTSFIDEETIDKANNETTNQEMIEEPAVVSYDISGTYEFDYPEDYASTAFVYEFDNGKVTFMSDGTSVGTYTIEGNKLHIEYYATYNPFDEPMETLTKEETMIIEDENTLIASDGERFIKEQ